MQKKPTRILESAVKPVKSPVVTLPGPKAPREDQDQQAWYTFLDIDLIFRVIQTSVLHPFIASLVPICMLALATPTNHIAVKVSSAWAMFLIVWTIGSIALNDYFDPPREIDWEDEVVVITGGARGLGRLLAEVFALRGISVAVLDIEPMEAIVGVSYYNCDVGDSAAVQETVKKIVSELGPPSILINNAVTVLGKALPELSIADINRSVQTNLLGPLYMLQTLLPHLLARPNGCHIITVSSVLGHLNARSLPLYSLSKAALISLHESLELDIPVESRKTVKTILVTPGQLNTPLFAHMKSNRFFAPVVQASELVKEILRRIDDGRGGVVAVPAYAALVQRGIWATLPIWVKKIARRFSGIDEAYINGSKKDL